MTQRRTVAEPTPDASRLTFPVQLVIWITSAVLASAAGSWLMRSDIRSLGEEQLRMSRSIAAIEAKLPNKEVLDVRLQGIEQKQAELTDRIHTLETYNQNLREKLARKGDLD